MFASLKRRLAQKNRRIKQELAQKYGHAEVTDDDAFLQASKHFLDTENNLQQFVKNVERYCHLQSEQTQCQAALATDMLTFCEKESEAYNGIRQYADTLGRIQAEHTVSFTNMLKENLSAPQTEHQNDLPNVKDMMEKRVRKKTDMDYYKQKLATLQSKGKNEKLGDTEDKLRSATVIYNQVSDGLLDWYNQVDLLANSTACQTAVEQLKGQKNWMFQCQDLQSRAEPQVCAECADADHEPQNWAEATSNASYKNSLSGTVIVLNSRNEIEDKSVPAKSLFSPTNLLGKAFTSNFLYSYSHAQMKLKNTHQFTTIHQQSRPNMEYMVNLVPFDRDSATIHVPRNFRYSMVELQPQSSNHNNSNATTVTPLQIETLSADDVILSEFHNSVGYLNSRQPAANLTVNTSNNNGDPSIVTPMTTPTASTTTSTPSSSASTLQLSVPATIIEEQPVDYVQALYTFKPTRPTEMMLKEGDIILVKRKHKSGWWLGECTGVDNVQKQGYFPSNYTKQIDVSVVEKARAAPISNTPVSPSPVMHKVAPPAPISIPTPTAVQNVSNSSNNSTPVTATATTARSAVPSQLYGTQGGIGAPPPPPPPPTNGVKPVHNNNMATLPRPATAITPSATNNNIAKPPPPPLLHQQSQLRPPTQPQPSLPKHVQAQILATPRLKPINTAALPSNHPPPPPQIQKTPTISNTNAPSASPNIPKRPPLPPSMINKTM